MRVTPVLFSPFLLSALLFSDNSTIDNKNYQYSTYGKILKGKKPLKEGKFEDIFVIRHPIDNENYIYGGNPLIDYIDLYGLIEFENNVFAATRLQTYLGYNTLNINLFTDSENSNVHANYTHYMEDYSRWSLGYYGYEGAQRNFKTFYFDLYMLLTESNICGYRLLSQGNVFGFTYYQSEISDDDARQFSFLIGRYFSKLTKSSNEFFFGFRPSFIQSDKSDNYTVFSLEFNHRTHNYNTNLNIFYGESKYYISNNVIQNVNDDEKAEWGATLSEKIRMSEHNSLLLEYTYNSLKNSSQDQKLHVGCRYEF